MLNSRQFLLFLLVLLHCLVQISAAFGANAAITASEMTKQITRHITDVAEFKFLREEAAKMGLRVWLFGGTAAAYSHYTKWDLLRERGEKSLDPSRFDYDYASIFNSTQDLDIVIDGNPEDAQKLEKLLAEKFQHFQGQKSAWEVRLLKKDMGDKQALLNNPDFLNQHTDSNSTGMVEITAPPEGESAIRDLRDWDAKGENNFLKDIREGKLHYYYSPKHFKTKFYQAGRNPEIISVIRYLTKAFQYGLELREEDLAQVREIIEKFNPRGPEMQNEYVRKWLLEKPNGRKLVRNAQDMAQAWDVMDKLGLRKKLIEVEDNAAIKGSLAWWLSKKPLAPRPLGQGKGKTAKQLGLDVVAHTTGDTAAFESIVRSPFGSPNVFVSRKGDFSTNVGEVAALGEGFYVKVGEQGAWDNGFNVRFHLDPMAREGEDFTYRRDLKYLVIKNKAALRVIPGSLDLDSDSLIRVLADYQFDENDRGWFEQLRRKLNLRLARMSESELSAFYQQVKQEVAGGNDSLLKIWLSSQKASNFPDIWKEIRPEMFFRLLAKEENPVMLFPGRANELRESIQAQLVRLKPDELAPILETVREQVKENIPMIDEWFRLPISSDQPAIIETMLNGNGPTKDRFSTYGFSHPHSAKLKKVALRFLEENPSYAGHFAERVLSQAMAADWEEVAVFAFSKMPESRLQQATYNTMGAAHTTSWKKAAETILNRGHQDSTRALMESVFTNTRGADWRDIAEKITRSNSPKPLYDFARLVLSKPYSAAWGDLALRVAEKGKEDSLGVLLWAFSLPHAADWEAARRMAVAKSPPFTLREIAPYFKEMRGEAQGELLKEVIERADKWVLHHFAQEVFSLPHSVAWHEQAKRLLERGNDQVRLTFARKVLTKPHGERWLDLAEMVVEKADSDTLKALQQGLFASPYGKSKELLPLRKAAKIQDLEARKKYLKENFSVREPEPPAAKAKTVPKKTPPAASCSARFVNLTP